MKIRVTCTGCSRVMLATVQETVEIMEVKCPNCSKILQCKIKVKSKVESKIEEAFGASAFEQLFGKSGIFGKGKK